MARSTPQVTSKDVKSLARLANLSINSSQLDKYKSQFQDILKLVTQINTIDTKNVEQTNQVTGMTNITREDMVEPERVLTQKQALQNASHTHQGYIVVDRLIKD